jgi:Rieske 2Fe-2S family protein
VLPLSRADLDGVLAPCDRAEQLPARVHFDPAIFAFERAAIFARAWLCVGREDEIALPGAWIRADVGGEDVIAVRGVDLALRGFHNVCAHRGAPLCDGASGRVAAFQCPYHGWIYELAGTLREAPHTASLDGFHPEEHGLSPVRVEAWQGFLFATLAPEEVTPPLATALGAPPERVAHTGLRQLRLGRRTTHVVAANWKLLAENFQESLHFASIHPGLERLTPAARAHSLLGDGPWLGGTMDIVGGAGTVAVDGDRRHRPWLPGTRPEDRHRVFDALLFPGLLMSLQPDYLLTYRLVPLAPAETRVIADIHFHPAAFTAAFDPENVYAFWDRVNAEDRAVCERQQLGIRSRGYRPGRYTSVEDGVHAFDRLVAAHYLAALTEPA